MNIILSENLRLLSIILFFTFFIFGCHSSSLTKEEQDLINQELKKGMSDDDVNIALEEIPEIIGGMAELQRKIIYPKEALSKGISGRVLIMCIVNKEGNVIDPKVVKGIGFGCDEAAIEALKKVKFKPGKYKGKIVESTLTVPVYFEP